MVTAAWLGALGLVLAVLAGHAGWSAWRLRLTGAQAIALMPLTLIGRLVPGTGVPAMAAPVIYAVSQRGPFDAAAALALLPADTLHILDEASAASGVLEPWRALARTIAFNAHHVFVSRRLVRHLRGGGRLAVYIPADVEPDARAFRLYRAIARIATRADAAIVAVAIARRGAWPRPARLSALPAATITALTDGSTRPPTTAASALFDRVAEARFAAALRTGTLHRALVEAAQVHGPDRAILDDPLSGRLTYRRILVGARALARPLTAGTAGGEAIGIMLPNGAGLVAALFAVQSAGRVAAMVNYSAGPAAIASALSTARIGRVVSARSFIAKAGLEAAVAAIEAAGAKLVWLEECRDRIGPVARLSAALAWRWPVARADAAAPAVILFTSGSEGSPKAVVLSHRNLLANVGQVEERIAFDGADRMLNPLPCFHSFGLTAGTLLPLLGGISLVLYPSPLHYKQIAQLAGRVRPSVLLGTDTFLAAWAKVAGAEDFAGLRLVVAGAEPVKAETRRLWRERFGAAIVEGYGATEAAPVIAVNSATHGREGTVGRLMPAMRARLLPVEGIEGAGRLLVAGPNVMTGLMNAARPGEIEGPAEGWHDTGDIVAVDRDGFLAIAGRAKRFAKIAGEMISLGAVEMLVESLWPEDRHAAVATPDRKRGERIVLVTTARDADRTALRRHSKARGYPELMVPDAIVTTPELPLLGSGKTDYPAVRAVALAALGEDKTAS